MLSKIKKFINPEASVSHRYGARSLKSDILSVIVIVLVAFVGFGLGRLSKIEEGRTPVSVENMGASVGSSLGPSEVLTEEGGFVASKNSSKYHFPWCPGALRIKEENKIWFSSREEAEKVGYSPAANCKGL